MKVAIDFREAARPNRAGKGEYVFQLVSAWLSADLGDELILVIERGQRISLSAGNWRPKVIPVKGIVWHLGVILWLEFLRPADIYLSATSLLVPALARSVKTVTVLFDFTTWRFPATHLPKAVALERLFMPWALKFSRHLLAISEFTKREAIDLFHIAPDRITVTPLSAAPQFRPFALSPQAITSLQQKYHLPERFILYLGTLEPRKNLPRLITAYRSVASQFPDTKLVLAGAYGWLTDKLLATPSPDIILTGYIEDGDRPSLYNLAAVFVFPSLYEGFGLPPLEAMACGTPVITSNVASLPEVVGDAALLIDPANSVELVGALVQVLGSPSLRAELREKGLTQAKKFNWGKTAALTQQTIHRYG